MTRLSELILGYLATGKTSVVLPVLAERHCQVEKTGIK